jgi:hypothetical protein
MKLKKYFSKRNHIFVMKRYYLCGLKNKNQNKLFNIMKKFNKLKRKMFLLTALAVCFLTGMNNANAQFSGGNGSSETPYIITSAQELALLAMYVNNNNTAYNNKYYKLNNNISLVDYQTEAGWTPIGISFNASFKGNFNGNYHIITNLKINFSGSGESAVNMGLFGNLNGGTVKNIGVENIDIVAHYIKTGGYTGYLCAGGIAGYVVGTVSNCYATGTITTTGSSTYTGGVVGWHSGGTTSNCYSTCAVSTTTTPSSAAMSGGIVGSCGGTVKMCAALNPKIICSSSYYGRVAGYNSYGTLSSNIAWTDMENPNSTTVWNNVGATNLDGEGKTLAAIHADGTLGGRFTSADGWVTQNGKLPGFGAPVDMPGHLQLQLPPTITTTNLPNGTVGTAYSQTLTATGDTPITWALESGNLPTGLNVLANGAITGTPMIEGTFNFTVKATNSVGSDSKALSIKIESTALPPTITTTTLPNGKVETAYNQTLTATGTAPISWALEGGNPPAGLNILANGTISGTPMIEGTFNFTVKATNTAGSDSKSLTIVIDGNIGISENSGTDVKIYPNPTTGQLRITNYELRISNVDIYDVYGRKLLSHTPNRLPQTVLDISHLPNGVYFVRILSDDTVIGNKKIVKM